ncbi:hypothetical protein TNCV_2902881 [Trichonephila clavipes]|nr:hypothetical protein TNCV_2902881 [Trichonephila clavipes]
MARNVYVERFGTVGVNVFEKGSKQCRIFMEISSHASLIKPGQLFKNPLGNAGKTGREKKKKEGERENEKKELEKTRAGRFRKRRENPEVLFRDADQASKTGIRKNALRTGPRHVVERATSKRGYHTG